MQSHSSIEPSMIKLKEALKKHFCSRLHAETDAQNASLVLFHGLVNYIVKAWKVDLDRRQECALAGSDLLDSAVRMTGRRFASNVEEANELFLAGMSMSNCLWDELDKEKGETSSFKAKVEEINAFLRREFFTLKAPGTEHVRIPNIRARSNNNMVKRLHGTIRKRNKVIRGLDEETTAQTMMKGMKIRYNSTRSHMNPNGKTPAEACGIKVEGENKWLTLIQNAHPTKFDSKIYPTKT